MQHKTVQSTRPAGQTIDIANDKPFVLFGGMMSGNPRYGHAHCETYVEVTSKLGIPYVFKAQLRHRPNRSSRSTPFPWPAWKRV